MSTGYTNPVREGIDFRTFVLRCARAIDYLGHMRDLPMDVLPPRKTDPEDYHLQEIKKCEEDLSRAEEMSLEEAERCAEVASAYAKKSNAEANKKTKEDEQKYREMLREVSHWDVEGTGLSGLKEFMISQLQETIDMDCKPLVLAVEEMSGESWLKELKYDARSRLDYHRKRYQKELDRTEACNKWLQELYDSLPPEEVSVEESPEKEQDEVSAEVNKKIEDDT